MPVILERMGHQKHLGPAYPVTAEWREQVKARLEELEWTQAHLAAKVKCAPATITNIMRDNVQSRLVPAIHKALGWPVPGLPDESTGDDPDADELVEIYQALPEETRELALKLVRQLGAHRRKGT